MMFIYCTFDKVSESYSPIWTAKNDNVAKRNIKIASMRQNLPLSDIILVKLGSYNDDLGQIEGLEDVDPLKSVEISLIDDIELDKK